MMTTNDSQAFDQIADWENRAKSAQTLAAKALTRLIRQAEAPPTGQRRQIAEFLAATLEAGQGRIDPFMLRTVDVMISDDMLPCLDAVRWGCGPLHALIPGGHSRIADVLNNWQLASA